MKLLIFLKRYVEMRMILKDNSKNFSSLYNNRKYYVENFGINRIHQYLDYVEHTKRQVSEISGRKVSDFDSIKNAKKLKPEQLKKIINELYYCDGFFRSCFNEKIIKN